MAYCRDKYVVGKISGLQRHISSLSYTFCRFPGDGSNIRVEPKEVSKRHDLLQKYLDHQADSELQALYALQALVTKLKHPAGKFHIFSFTQTVL